ncbi:MAG: thioredoxin domain-containing protein [Candidatus Andersenbacteria bacterium]|nr:thioredoxin domain-containing protein [bacterium]MDZ4225258.1 thioredoxin domain-containing protein [Candidatus Andersenbacteria bacterium]
MSGDNPSSENWGLPVAIVLAGAVLAGVVYMNMGGEKMVESGEDNRVQAEVAGVTMYKMDQAVQISEDDIIIGDTDAPVTLVMFADFECLYCREWFAKDLPWLEREYLDTGKVKLVYKSFPLSDVHPWAQTASLTAYCAAQQGEFLSYARGVYAAEDLSDEGLNNLALQIGLDVDNFNKCRDSEEAIWQIAGDAHDAVDIGVTANPTFVIGDKVYVGVLPYDTLKEDIEIILSDTSHE